MPVTKSERSIIRKNSTGSEFTNRRINFIEGSNVTLTVSSDATDNEVDVTIASAGGSSALNQGLANKVAYWVNASLISHASAIHYDTSTMALGVGTSAPEGQFEVRSDTTGSAYAQLSNRNTVGNTIFNFSESSFGFPFFIKRYGSTATTAAPNRIEYWNANNGPQVWATNNVERMTLTGGGLLGVADTGVGAGERLTLGQGSRLAIAYSTGISQSSGYGKFYVKPSDGLAYFMTPAGVEYDLTATGAGGTGIQGSGVVNKLPYFGTASTLSAATGLHWDATNRMLGINTSSPTAALQIGGGGYLMLGNHNTAGGRIRFYDNATDSSVELYAAETFAGEKGILVPQLRLTGGRFDFNPNGGKAEIRVTGASTQINWYNTDNAQYIMQTESSDRSSKWFGDNRLDVAKGSDLRYMATNSENANTAANAGFLAEVGGTGGGDPKITWNIPGAAGWSMGLDNSNNDLLMISGATVVGTNPVLVGNASAYVAIGTTNLHERLTVEGRMAISFTTGVSPASGYGKMYVKPSDGLLYYTTQAGVEYDLTATGGAGGGTVGGSGVINKLSYWATASTLSTASAIHYTNGFLGIGTSSPSLVLDISGSLRVSPVTLAVVGNTATALTQQSNSFFVNNATVLQIGNPIHAAHGMKILYAVKNTGTNPISVSAASMFRFGTDITSFATISSLKTHYIGAFYNGVDARWDVLAETKGY